MQSMIPSLLAALFLFAVTATGDTGVPAISALEAQAKVEAGEAVLIDIREQSELEASGIAEGAVWLAKSEIDADSDVFQEFVASLDEETEVILYCRSGRRAGVVAPVFQDLGFVTYNMGGLRDWIAAGLPVVDFDPGE